MCLNNKLVPIGLLTLFVRRLCLQPLQVWQGRRPFSAIDHHWKEAKFATAGSQLDVWDHDRSEPIHSFNWGVESLLTCKWNPAEAGLLASTATDRNLALYDIREASPVRKLIMAVRHGRCALRRFMSADDVCLRFQHKTNALDWNPREPFNFSIVCSVGGCEPALRVADAWWVYRQVRTRSATHSTCGSFRRHSKYTRTTFLPCTPQVGSPSPGECPHQRILCDCSMDLSYAPTGKEFVTGSYDRTVRIFGARSGKSREVYHTKRMQR